MKKVIFSLLCLVSLACLIALPFLCTHSEMLPEKVTEYYEKQAQDQASAATGAEAELMALLLGGGAAPAPIAETEEEAFSLSFSSFGLYLLIGTVLGLGMLLIEAKLLPHLRPALLWTATLSLPLGLIGGRLIYCLGNLSFFISDIGAPLAMLRIWEGGLSMAGALFFIALSGMIGAKIGKAKMGAVLDGLVPSMMIFFFFSTFALREIDMGFGLELEGRFPFFVTQVGDTYRLNTPLLMMLFSLLPLYAHHRSLRQKQPQGHAFALSAFLYGGGMLLLESLRKDGHMLMGFVHMEMMLDMAIALPALLYLAGKAKRIPLALLASVMLAGAVIGLEFALDRAAIGDIFLYLIYILAISSYLWLGWACAKKAAAV